MGRYHCTRKSGSHISRAQSKSHFDTWRQAATVSATPAGWKCEGALVPFCIEPADLSAGGYRRVDSVHGQGKQHKHENWACIFHPHGRERTVLTAEALRAGLDEGALASFRAEPADLSAGEYWREGSIHRQRK